MFIIVYLVDFIVMYLEAAGSLSYLHLDSRRHPFCLRGLKVNQRFEEFLLIFGSVVQGTMCCGLRLVTNQHRRACLSSNGLNTCYDIFTKRTSPTDYPFLVPTGVL